MKLLLTSGGITNPSIAAALFDLVGKNPEETSIVFIPTAANIETGDKQWLADDLQRLRDLHLHSFEVIDIATVAADVWRPKMEAADVIFVGGGNTYYLMEQMNTSGLADLLPELLKTRVYAGISAGSMVTNPDLSLKISNIVYDEDLDKKEVMAGLGFVDFYFLPHLHSEHFPKMREENIRVVTNEMIAKVYALDDQSALKIVDGKVEIVSEGKFLVLNER